MCTPPDTMAVRSSTTSAQESIIFREPSATRGQMLRAEWERQEQHDETGGASGEAPGKSSLHNLLDVLLKPETVIERKFENQVLSPMMQKPSKSLPATADRNRDAREKTPSKGRNATGCGCTRAQTKHSKWRYLRKPPEALRKPPATSDRDARDRSKLKK